MVKYLIKNVCTQGTGANKQTLKLKSHLINILETLTPKSENQSVLFI